MSTSSFSFTHHVITIIVVVSFSCCLILMLNPFCAFFLREDFCHIFWKEHSYIIIVLQGSSEFFEANETCCLELYWCIFIKVATNSMDAASTARTIVCSYPGAFRNNAPGLWSTDDRIIVNWLYHGGRTVMFLVMLIRWEASNTTCLCNKVLHDCFVLFPLAPAGILYWELLFWCFAYLGSTWYSLWLKVTAAIVKFSPAQF